MPRARHGRRDMHCAPPAFWRRQTAQKRRWSGLRPESARTHAEQRRAQWRMRIAPGANLARRRRNHNACGQEPAFVVALERLAVGVAQKAGAVGDLRRHLGTGRMAWYSAISVNQRRKAAWSAGSVRRRKSGVPSPKRSVRRSGDCAAALSRKPVRIAAWWRLGPECRMRWPVNLARQSRIDSTTSAASGVSITLRPQLRVRALAVVTGGRSLALIAMPLRRSHLS